MRHQDRIASLEALGFTPRQARFLETVMLTSGVCVPRQYAEAAGIALGHTTREFFAWLTTRRFATAYPCWQGTARVYHLHSKTLYRAIGEPDNRHRRPTTVGRAVERLMVLDAVLSDPSTRWLTTEADKVEHFRNGRSVDVDDLPSLAFGSAATPTVRYFPQKLPIGVVQDGDRNVFLYLATEAAGREFGAFVEAHRPLLQRLHRWTLRLCIPSPLSASRAAHERVIADLVAPPVRPATIDELRWFCEVRRQLEERSSANALVDEARYGRARRAFGALRFYAAYRRWKQLGEAAFNDLRSPLLHDAWQRGDARLEVHELQHQYLHLAPVVATA